MKEIDLKKISLDDLNKYTVNRLAAAEKIQCTICKKEISRSGFGVHVIECEKILSTKEQIKILHAQGLADFEIAKELNTFTQSIARHRKDLNLPGNRIDELSPIDKQKIISDVYHNGQRLSSIQIAKTTGFSKTIVCRALKDLGLESWTDIIQKEEEAIYLTEKANGLKDSHICKKYGWFTLKTNRMKTKFGF